MAQLPGGSVADWWWLKPSEPDNPLPAIQLGMQNAHQQRLDKIALAEQAYKTQVREEISMGAAELSRVIAENFKSGDISSPESQSRIWEVGTKYPTLLSSTVWKEYGDMMQNQEQIKLRKFQTESLNFYRKQQGAINQQKADAATSRALTYELNSQDRSEIDRANLEIKQLNQQDISEYRDSQIALNQAKIDSIVSKHDLRTRELAELTRRNDLAEKKFNAELSTVEKASLAQDMKDLNRRIIFGEFRDPNIKDAAEQKHAQTIAVEQEKQRILGKYGSKAPEPTTTNEDGSREKPFKPASPADASKYPKGTWFLTPDGRLIQRQ